MDSRGIRVFLSGDVDAFVLKLKSLHDKVLKPILGGFVLEQKQKKQPEHRRSLADSWELLGSNTQSWISISLRIWAASCGLTVRSPRSIREMRFWDTLRKPASLA